MNTLVPSTAAHAVAARLVGVDWGTTHRRVYALDAGARLLREHSDDAGVLKTAGRFAESLGNALERVGPLEPGAHVVLSGMVGSAQGWHEAPYLETTVPLRWLPAHLNPVRDAPAGIRCSIVPGYCWRGEGAAVDVMRGEETQLLGAVGLGQRDGWFVLPGTHSKWVQLRDGCIERLATYMTGELFALLSQQGTLASLVRESIADEAAFAQGLRAAGEGALSNALFGCRARIVTGSMPAGSARDYLSGVLIGAEWHDAMRATAAPLGTVSVIGTPELASRYVRAGAVLGVRVSVLDARRVYLRALAALGGLTVEDAA